MAKKGGNKRLMARGPSYERAVRLTNALQMAQKKELAEPTGDGVQEMRAAIGDDPTFAKLSDVNKAMLFRRMLTIRLRLQIYTDRVEFEEEKPGPLLSSLRAVVAAIADRHGLLTVIVDEMVEVHGLSLNEAWRKIDELVGTAEMLREIVQKMPPEPKFFDMRTVGSLRERHEALMIRDCLEQVGVRVMKTDAYDHGGGGDPGLMLAVRIVRYTSGEKVETHTFRMRLSRAEAQFTGKDERHSDCIEAIKSGYDP
jgi:hypothetical protein